MAADFIVLLTEFRFLQTVLRDGPIPPPPGGADWVSVAYLIERGLLEIDGSEIQVTLLGAVVATADVRYLDDTAVMVPASSLVGCDRDRSPDPSGSPGDRREEPGPRASPDSAH